MAKKKDIAQETITARNAKRDLITDKKRVNSLADKVEQLQKEMEAMLALSRNVVKGSFKHIEASDDTEAVAVVLASDWHIEEPVKRQSVNGLNEYNLEIAEKRIHEFFVNVTKLLKKEQENSRIDTLILWLGGDFNSNNIHDELLETNQLTPIEAILQAQ